MCVPFVPEEQEGGKKREKGVGRCVHRCASLPVYVCVLPAIVVLMQHLPAAVYKRQRHDSSASHYQFSVPNSSSSLTINFNLLLHHQFLV